MPNTETLPCGGASIPALRGCSPCSLSWWAAGCILQPTVFPTFSTLRSVCKQLVEYGLLALGVAVCMMSGGIDLSVVYLANLVAIVIGQYLKATVGAGVSAPLPLVMLGAVFIALAVGLLGGLFNGLLVGQAEAARHAGDAGYRAAFHGLPAW